MASPEDQKGAIAPENGDVPSPAVPDAPGDGVTSDTHVSYEQVTDASIAHDELYTYGETGSSLQTQAGAPPAVAPPPVTGGSGAAPPPPPPPDSEDDGDEDGMMRMSFLEHLEELRRRLLYAIGGVGVAFVLSLTFSNQLWSFVSAPAVDALRQLGYKNTTLTQITPMEVFNVVWVKLPILAAIFLSSPWILYQVWAFIAPGLYPRERKWAAPFVICSAGLFIGGGLFGYFVAFRFGLTFLLGLGRGNNITPMVSVTEYFDLFVNVLLGIGLVFELPVLIFFLTLLRVVSPRFLIAHSRYAILGIVLLAAIVTPTPDIFNLMLFATPMCALFYLGVFASYLLVLHREERAFPWAKILTWTAVFLVLMAVAAYFVLPNYGYHFLLHWPFVTR